MSSSNRPAAANKPNTHSPAVNLQLTRQQRDNINRRTANHAAPAVPAPAVPGPAPASLQAGMMAAMVAATTPSQSQTSTFTTNNNNNTTTQVSAFVAGVNATQAHVTAAAVIASTQHQPGQPQTPTRTLAAVTAHPAALAGVQASQQLSTLLYSDPSCPFKRYTFTWTCPPRPTRTDLKVLRWNHRPKLHSLRRRKAVMNVNVYDTFPLPLSQQLQRQLYEQWRALCRTVYSRQERYEKIRGFQAKLAANVHHPAAASQWVLRLNKKFYKRTIRRRQSTTARITTTLPPSPPAAATVPAATFGTAADPVLYRSKGLRTKVREDDQFRCQLISKRARWNKTKLQHRLTQGASVRALLQGPLYSELFQHKVRYSKHKLVTHRSALALEYTITQGVEMHTYYQNILKRRMNEYFLQRKQQQQQRTRSGGPGLTCESVKLYNQITEIHRNEQTVHQKAIDDLKRQAELSHESLILQRDQQAEYYLQERQQIVVSLSPAHKEWLWKLWLGDQALFQDHKRWKRWIFIRPCPSPLIVLDNLPEMPEYAIPLPELLKNYNQETSNQMQEAAISQKQAALVEEQRVWNLELQAEVERIRQSTVYAQWQMGQLQMMTRGQVPVERQQEFAVFMQQAQRQQAVLSMQGLQYTLNMQQQIMELAEQQQKYRNHNRMLAQEQQHQVLVHQQRQQQQQQQQVVAAQQQQVVAQVPLIPQPVVYPVVPIIPMLPIAPGINHPPPQPIIFQNNVMLPPTTNFAYNNMGEDIDMDYTPETAIREWRYIPLHINPDIAATLATMNLDAALKRLPCYNSSTFVHSALKHGYIHLTQCVLSHCIANAAAGTGPPLPQLYPMRSFLAPPRQSLLSRAGEAAIKNWVYVPKHVDPGTALTLAYLDMKAAHRKVGFSFCGTLEDMGHDHQRMCIPRLQQQQEEERKKEVERAAAAAAAAAATMGGCTGGGMCQGVLDTRLHHPFCQLAAAVTVPMPVPFPAPAPPATGSPPVIINIGAMPGVQQQAPLVSQPLIQPVAPVQPPPAVVITPPTPSSAPAPIQVPIVLTLPVLMPAQVYAPAAPTASVVVLGTTTQQTTPPTTPPPNESDQLRQQLQFVQQRQLQLHQQQGIVCSQKPEPPTTQYVHTNLPTPNSSPPPSAIPPSSPSSFSSTSSSPSSPSSANASSGSEVAASSNASNASATTPSTPWFFMPAQIPPYKKRSHSESSPTTSWSDSSTSSTSSSDSDENNASFSFKRRKSDKQKSSSTSTSAKTKTAEFKAWRRKDLERRRWAARQLYRQRPSVLSNRSSLPPSLSASSSSSSLSSSSTSRKRVLDETNGKEETAKSSSSITTSASSSIEGSPKHRRASTSDATSSSVSSSTSPISRQRTREPSSSSSSRPMTKKIESLLSSSIRNKQAPGVRDQGKPRDIKKFNP